VKLGNSGHGLLICQRVEMDKRHRMHLDLIGNHELHPGKPHQTEDDD
jgi:hypothetical protein